MYKIENDNISRRRFIKASAGAVGTIAMGGLLMGAKKTPAPIKIGLVNPLEGECAQWGIPIFHGGQIWADEHNARGGILCGDGERHPIEYKGYTNVCYLPNEELKAFKKAILDDGMKYMFQTYTPACRRAVGAITTKKKVLTNSYGAGFLSAKYPYLFGGVTGTPTSFIGLAASLIEKHPEIKRVALLFTDNSYGHADRFYTRAGCAPYEKEGRIKVVYDEVFNPGMTDYFPLMSAILKKKPDVIFNADLPAGKQAILLETGYHLKYDGFWVNHTWNLPHILTRCSPEQLDGKLYQGGGVEAAEPSYSDRMHNMYKTFVKRYGEKEWMNFAGVTYSSMATLEPAFAASPSIDPEDVKNTLYGMPEIDHPIYGKSKWSGKDIFGVNHHLLTPTPKYMFSGGENKLSGVYDLGPWWKKYGKIALPILEKGKLTS